jgi:hypothetical protein
MNRPEVRGTIRVIIEYQAAAGREFRAETLAMSSPGSIPKPSVWLDMRLNWLDGVELRLGRRRVVDQRY